MSDRIEWMNLSRQYEQYKDEFDEAISRVCRETAFSGGKYAVEFEETFAKYCGVGSASGVNSGTAALFLGIKALGISENDEVIVPANTFIASAWGVSHNDARPVFTDIDPDTFEIDPEKIEERITSRTKAIIGVHLYGQPFDIESVKKIADKYGLYLIEDCAQAHGAVYKEKKVGGYGNIGCFSFYPGKNLGAFGEAGAVVSDDKDIIKKINTLKNHGCEQRYYHDMIGYNMRMEGIQGSVLSCKLKYLDEWNARRRSIAGMYFENIHNDRIKMQMQPEWSESVFHLFVAEVDDRDKFIRYLDDNGISCGIHYPIPCHLQKAYACFGYKKGDIPCSEYHAEHCVSLPMFPELRTDEIEKVIEVCNKYC